jgi:hypothetical protein
MPRISELFHSDVVDVAGTRLGSVDDVRLVQDGPLIAGFGAALRVDGLVVGRGGIAVRLGYHRHRVKGPALVKAIAAALERRALFVPWADVDSWDGELVRLRVGRADLRRVVDVY